MENRVDVPLMMCTTQHQRIIRQAVIHYLFHLCTSYSLPCTGSEGSLACFLPCEAKCTIQCQQAGLRLNCPAITVCHDAASIALVSFGGGTQKLFPTLCLGEVVAPGDVKGTV